MTRAARMEIDPGVFRPIEKDRTRVCGIMFRPDRDHESRCVSAWRRREHPAWSQHCVSFRVTERPRLALAKSRGERP